MLSAFRICNNVDSSQRTTKTKPITNVFFFSPSQRPTKTKPFTNVLSQIIHTGKSKSQTIVADIANLISGHVHYFSTLSREQFACGRLGESRP